MDPLHRSHGPGPSGDPGKYSHSETRMSGLCKYPCRPLRNRRCISHVPLPPSPRQPPPEEMDQRQPPYRLPVESWWPFRPWRSHEGTLPTSYMQGFQALGQPVRHSEAEMPFLPVSFALPGLLLSRVLPLFSYSPPIFFAAAKPENIWYYSDSFP